MLLRLLPGAVTLLVGLVLALLVVPLGVDDPGFSQPHTLAPHDFPDRLSWLVVFCGILLLLVGWMQPGTEAVSPGPIRLRRAIPFAAGFAAFVLLIPVIGIELSAFCFIMGLFLFASDIGWGRALIVAGVFALVIHLLFIRLAGVPIPSIVRLIS
ncbi:tripartite tricarboxylate transporter TctB family protein [Chachezhania sediminis]|uniref:tripartite tricarboxylate transporter TctB family protein n=1 Tax=Chachezhania sediminis TaxID=2599291 RepID=UPI00131E90FA|nr:tripartite tricarboxylate transporter TctB family protein [Chachezhania sediminis]